MNVTELIVSTLRHIRPIDILDIGAVAYFVYRGLLLVRGTRAMALLNGLFLLLLVIWLTSPLQTFNWLIRNLMLPSVIAVVVIFQPELRMALERLGRAGVYGAQSYLSAEDQHGLISELADTMAYFSANRIGALVVLERTAPLTEVARTGKTLDALFSQELLATLFFPRSPLHDGAVIVRGNRIVAAGCVLPHSESPGLSVTTGLRHRAALGITERTDAVAVVASEETGNISLAVDGTLSPALEKVELMERLLRLFEAHRHHSRLFFWRR
ncbi:MAG: diadenylate cyclase CdaA [Armatimonadetes bacterium]|nr:diadenylate cyclase CdaA [Armatimonadota bacterium]